MISFATFVLAAIPFCEGTRDLQECTAWMANDMAIDQVRVPGRDLGFYLENAAERIPSEFWEPTK